MSIIAIITARGGSKRIPKKNIRPFCGKPIIAYSIEAALESDIFDEAMVSTDSEEIKAVAEEYGASVPFMRSKETSNDYATTADVLLEVVSDYKQKLGKQFDYICCIYPTAPFVTTNKLRSAWAKLNTSGADSIAAVVKYSFPPQRGFFIRDGKVRFMYPEFERTRSQDIEPLYHDAGQFYIIRSTALQKYHSLIVPNTVPFTVSEEEVQDIDTESDWNIAEIKYKNTKNTENLRDTKIATPPPRFS